MPKSTYKTAQTYYIQTYGCQANKSDSERIAGDFESRGFTLANSWQNCDQLVINTCAVRKRAEDRARAFIHKVTAYYQQQDKPKPKIIFTGCMLHHGAERLLRMEPAIDQVMPVNQVGFNQTAVRRDRKHAWVPISSGCNSFCTYCIVPYSRGREQSRPMNEILTEVEELTNNGYEEITLLGQNVNSYGLEKVGISLRKMMMSKPDFNREDLPSNQSQYLKPDQRPPFVELLQKISKIDQVKKIRFLSSNPWDFHDELIAEIGRNQKIDRYVHLPIQSGSDTVLERMNRGYTREDYLQLVSKLRAADPKIVLGTDIIVGFPGETDEEFAQTVDLARQVGWKVAFVAQYSVRPGTAADKLYEDDIPPAVKKERFKILDKIINKNHLHERPKVV